MRVSIWTAYYLGILTVLIPILILYLLALVSETFASNLFYWLGASNSP